LALEFGSMHSRKKKRGGKQKKMLQKENVKASCVVETSKVGGGLGGRGDRAKR